MASAAHLDSDDQQLLQDLGLACWGARRFGHLLDHAWPRQEWVAIYHVQFCRHGSASRWRAWDGSWTLEEQLKASISFYRRHGWLVACNRQQKKFQRADRRIGLAL
jgi:hypothetical protein